MEYISRETLLKKLFPYDVVDKSGYAINAKSLFNAICELEKADVEEVVRCEHCKHLTVINIGGAYARCEKTGYVFWSFRTDTREHYCAFGERR